MLLTIWRGTESCEHVLTRWEIRCSQALILAQVLHGAVAAGPAVCFCCLPWLLVCPFSACDALLKLPSTYCPAPRSVLGLKALYLHLSGCQFPVRSIELCAACGIFCLQKADPDREEGFAFARNDHHVFLGCRTILLCVVVGYELLGFEEIGIEIEAPFGYDYNDIPVDKARRSLHTWKVDVIDRSLSRECLQCYCLWRMCIYLYHPCKT